MGPLRREMEEPPTMEETVREEEEDVVVMEEKGIPVEEESEAGDREDEALENDGDRNRIPDPLVNVFTYELIEDAVVAEDNHVYDAASIKSWFENLRSQGREIISPHTKRVMGDTLRKPERTRQLDSARGRLRRRHSKKLDYDEADDIASVVTLGQIFAAIDPLRDLFKTMSWQVRWRECPRSGVWGWEWEWEGEGGRQQGQGGVAVERN